MANETETVGITRFGWLYGMDCRVLLCDHNGDGIFPDICPMCKRPFDYSILDELRENPLEVNS